MPSDNQLKLTLSGKAPASGVVVLSFYSRGPYRFQISHVSVEMAAGSAASISTAATCAVRNTGKLVSPAIAQGDAVSGPPPEYIGPSDVLTVEWAGCTAGNICTATITYTQVPL